MRFDLVRELNEKFLFLVSRGIVLLLERIPCRHTVDLVAPRRSTYLVLLLVSLIEVSQTMEDLHHQIGLLAKDVRVVVQMISVE